MEQLVARQAHNLEVVRSSRASATKRKDVKSFLFLFSTNVGFTNDYEKPVFFEGGAYGGFSFFNMAQRFFLFHGIEFKTDSKRVFLFIPVCTEQYELP